MNSILSKILAHNKENNLEFIEESHKYYVNKKEFISVTTKIGKYFPFKVDEISRKVAEKNWTTEDEVKETWDLLAKNGSHIHKLAEKYLNKEKLSKFELEKIEHVINFLEEHEQFEIIASEIQVFSKKYQVAGSIDLIVRDRNTNRLYTI